MARSSAAASASGSCGGTSKPFSLSVISSGTPEIAVEMQGRFWLEASTSTFGKPSRLMLDVIMDDLGAPLEQAIMIGDRLATDIAMGRRAGMDAALVLTGDSNRDDLAATPQEDQPTHVLERLIDLLPS